MTFDIRERIARQLDLEGESRSLGAERYRSQRPLPWRAEASAVEEEANLPPGRQLLKLAVEPVAVAIAEFVDRIESQKGAGRRPYAAKLLGMVDPKEAAYLIARVIVNSSALGNAAQATAFQIAEALLHHAEMLDLKKRNKPGYKGLIKSQKRRGSSAKKRVALGKLMKNEEVKIEVTNRDRLQAGMKSIELFCETTGLFLMEQVPHRKGVVYMVRPTEACRTWLDRQHARCEVLEPIHLPMVIRPRRWRTPHWGGYLTKRPGLKLVKQWNRPYNDELRNIDMEPVYRAVNNVQDTPWRINARILDIMREVWDGGGNLGGLPRRDDEAIPARPEDADDNPEALRAWKADAASAHQHNAYMMSKRLAVSQRLWIAQKFRDEEAIYYPHELDFRGRIYPIPVGGPHPQGEDGAKALLEFADGAPVGPQGAGWLAVHIANLFGVDKVSFEERIDWTFAHSAHLLDSAADPLDGDRFWTTADSPYCALAACFEWAGYVAEGDNFVSHLPVALDGSNSGLQHFSAMLRDPEGARAVNLLPCEKPQDVYKKVSGRTQEIVNASPTIEIKDGDDTLTIPNPWLGDRVTRKIAKRPCMTYCYSATRFGMQGMVLQTLREIDAENAEAGLPPHLGGADNYKAAVYISHVLWEVISQVVSAAAQAMDWLREAAKVAGEYGLPVWWTTPQGLPVLQAYRTVHAKRVEVHFGGKRLQLTTAVDGEDIDRRAQANGIAPNFVHSLDAAHLMAVVNEAADRGISHVAVIHDSFGTHAANAGALAEILRDTFVDQYTENRLEIFRDELAAQLPPELAERLPPLPAVGTLDIEQLRESAYMFA